MSEDVTADATAPLTHVRPGVWPRWGAWRRKRPFWGGLFLILAGAELWFSSNEDLGNLHVQIGVTGFLSYIVPLFIIVCGMLAWATPSQRLLYGILANAAAIYSIVSVNLGGFMLGMLFGITGGSLVFAWVPNRFDAAPAPRTEHVDPDPSFHDLFADNVDADDDEQGLEGKQGATFRSPRHAAPEQSLDGELSAAPLPQRAPRMVGLGLILVALTVAAVGFATLHDSHSAAAADCSPITLSDELKSASATAATKGSGGDAVVAHASVRAGNASLTRTGNGSSVIAAAEPSPGPVESLLNGIGGLLGLDPPSASPSGSPSDSPSDDPSTGQPTTEPTTQPATEPATQPGNPTATPTATDPQSSSATTPAPCAAVAKALAVAPGQPDVQNHVSPMTVSTLTMTNLAYAGNVQLPTSGGGTITAMEFTMDKAVNTPFQLDTYTKGHVDRITSSSLTVSGSVKFFATEFKGNALGILPQDYTPDNPPAIVPADIVFTGVTIDLVFVSCDTLSAKSLKIAMQS